MESPGLNVAERRGLCFGLVGRRHEGDGRFLLSRRGESVAGVWPSMPSFQ